MDKEVIIAILGCSGFWAVVMKLIDIWIARKTGMQKMLEEIRQSVYEERNERKQRDAEDARSRILQFADECRRNIRHSEEFFIQINADIAFYDTYCKAHQDFKNQRTAASEKIISKAYQHCLETDDFLK